MTQGLTILITGLPGAGKSTLANHLCERLESEFERTVTLLDGDAVRRILSPELQFSRANRELNLTRAAYVAGEVTKHGGIAICAMIAPYAESRLQVRKKISVLGCFMEAYLATPLAVCEKRDHKGLYAKARSGVIKQYTGISDPYEIPENPEIRMDMTHISPEEGAEEVINHALGAGYLSRAKPG